MSDFVSRIINLNTEIIKITANGILENPIYTIPVYLFPYFLALILSKHNLRAIFICNLIFGVSGVGWLAVLGWAFFELENKPRKPVDPDGRLCPNCFELIRFKAAICHHCHKPVADSAKAATDAKP